MYYFSLYFLSNTKKIKHPKTLTVTSRPLLFSPAHHNLKSALKLCTKRPLLTCWVLESELWEDNLGLVIAWPPLQTHSLLIFSTPAISFVRATVAQILHKRFQHSFERVNTRPFIHLCPIFLKRQFARTPVISAYISARSDKLEIFLFE